ncbi:MAG: FHA domain-containing protein [Planctomycetes bacterium]|nr:FHA domain-containing protein [Planctomycetota bacterium]MCC7169456.1 FHA domain-containing protein [Planctomycetota bacterium]
MRLVRTDADGRGEAIELSAESMIVGRQTTRGVQIEHPTVSREHARFFVRDGVWQIADLNSSNGTFVNGARVTKATLKPGDLVKLGSIELRLDDAAKPAAASDEIELEDDFFAAPPKTTATKPSAASAVDEIQLDEGPVTAKFPTPAKTPTGAGSISGAGAARVPAMPTPGPNLSTMPGAMGAPPPKRLSTQNLVRKSDEATSGGVLRHDIAQYGGFMKFVIVVVCVGAAYGLYLGVMKLTETVVPARTEAPASTETQDEAPEADK